MRADFVTTEFCTCCNGHRALTKIADQNHVARLCAARKRELLAVAREVEQENLVGLEVGQQYGPPAVEGQRPDVRDAVNRVYVGQGAPVRRPAQTGGDVDAQIG